MKMYQHKLFIKFIIILKLLKTSEHHNAAALLKP